MRNLIFGLVMILSLYSCAQNMKSDHLYTNNLIDETSPYLLQHAHNPVDWNPWGKSALNQAKEENKLLIISVGYAACHWCHVMEHESFEDSVIAQQMNANYVSVKVDREERPDIDQIYMDAAQLMTGRGGWPLNVIALPDGRPVFAGTYFSRDDWEQVLDYFAQLYIDQPEKLIEQAEKVTEGINALEVPTFNDSGLSFDENQYKQLGRKLIATMDPQYGGRNGSPKFPMPSIYEFLLTQDYFLKDKRIQKAVKVTLDHMADGGIYDHLGGGFARYSTDETWTVPHFEKMLYDNAQLISLYSHAYQHFGDPKYAQIVEETIAFCNRELSDEAGGFYSSLDADSEGEEGKFYVWTEEEIDSTLGTDADLFKTHYGVSANGNFEGRHILERKISIKQLVNKYQLSANEVKTKIDDAKSLLLAERSKRIRPGLDDKTLTSWNGLMIIGLVDAYFALQNENHLARALKVGKFLSKNQLHKSGKLHRNYKNGKSNIYGFLDDYAFTILGFIKLYEATFDDRWLEEALKMKRYVSDHFLNQESMMFYYTADSDDQLIARKMELTDNVIPGSNSAMANALFLLGQYDYNQADLDQANQMIANVEKDFMQQPYFYSNWSRIYGLVGQKHYEVAVVGKEAHQKKMALALPFIPNKIVLGSDKEGKLELLKGKYQPKKTLIYVCENKACQLPVTDPAQAIDQIKNH